MSLSETSPPVANTEAHIDDTDSGSSVSLSDSSDLEESSDIGSSSDEDDNNSTGSERSPSASQHRVHPKPSLRERLQSFLPQLEHANDHLDQPNDHANSGFELRAEGSGEEDEGYSSEAEDGPYIEMDLGLGVLEQLQKDPRQDIDVRLPGNASNEDNAPRKRGADENEDLDAGNEILDKLKSVSGGSRKKQRRSEVDSGSGIHVVADEQYST